MTREIEFRGFDGTKWYYGDLEYNRKTDVARIHTYKEDGSYDKQYTVDPDTVGEFTGMKDKYGNKVFEGDIVEYGRSLYVCEFVEGGFAFRDISDDRLTLNAILIEADVIGNVYDNLELLPTK